MKRWSYFKGMFLIVWRVNIGLKCIKQITQMKHQVPFHSSTF